MTEEQKAIVSLTAEVAKLRKQLEVARKYAEMIKAHYQHPKHDHNWAYYAKEQAEKALKEIEENETQTD